MRRQAPAPPPAGKRGNSHETKAPWLLTGVHAEAVHFLLDTRGQLPGKHGLHCLAMMVHTTMRAYACVELRPAVKSGGTANGGNALPACRHQRALKLAAR